jgi:hypothetical protein
MNLQQYQQKWEELKQKLQDKQRNEEKRLALWEMNVVPTIKDRVGNISPFLQGWKLLGDVDQTNRLKQVVIEGDFYSADARKIAGYDIAKARLAFTLSPQGYVNVEYLPSGAVEPNSETQTLTSFDPLSYVIEGGKIDQDRLNEQIFHFLTEVTENELQQIVSASL